MAGRLEDKVAIVTGGGAGIGEAICHKFAREGARVVVNGLPDDPVEDVVKQIRKQGGKAVAYLGDVSVESNAEACVHTALDEWGRLDVLVNNAGVFPATGVTEDFLVEDFDLLLRMNCRSAFLMTKFALPHLQKTQGNIVGAGSEAGLIGIAEVTPYGGTKGWMHSFIRGVAVEQAKHNVRANCVCPGPIDTAWTHKDTGPMNTRMEKMMISATPLGRRGTPEEIANVYAFLASDEASYITGALVSADGGISIAKGPVGTEAGKDAKKQPEGELDLDQSMAGLENKDYHRVS